VQVLAGRRAINHGVSLWISFPLFNRAIVLRYYHGKGWVQE